MSEEQVKGISVGMFKVWIEGIEEMQEEDWTPSPAQWKRIRQKIDQLEDEPEMYAPVMHPAQQWQPPQPNNGPVAGGYTPFVPSMSGLPSGPPPEMQHAEGPSIMPPLTQGGVPLRLETQNNPAGGNVMNGGRGGLSSFA